MQATSVRAMSGCSASSSFLGSSRVSHSFAPFRSAAPSARLHVTAAYGDLPKIGGGRKWKHAELTPNGKAVRVDMHVKKGDLVKVISGADKGTVGEITKVLPKKGTIVVADVNKHTKHVAPKGEGEKGELKVKEFPIHHSNVQLYSKAQGVASRVGHKVLENGKKVRYLLKTGETLN